MYLRVLEVVSGSFALGSFSLARSAGGRCADTSQPGFGRVCGLLMGALSYAFAFAPGLVWVPLFSISRIPNNPYKFMYTSKLDPVGSSFSLGSFFLERSAGLDAPALRSPDSGGVRSADGGAFVWVRFWARLGLGLSIFDFPDFDQSL